MSEIHIVISGGGKVGSFLARNLSDAGHTVVVIEKDPETCEKLARGTFAMVIQGDACDYRYQEEARVDRADVFAAVTGDDDDNLVACQLAKTSFGVPRTVARVNNPKNERIFNLMGIDAISSTTVISHLIEEETTIGDIITLHVMKKGKLAIVEVDIPSGGCGACGRPIKDLRFPQGCVLVAVIRGEEVTIPRGEDSLQPGDSVIAVTSVEKEEKLKKILTS
ncbi:MAG: TrkA family potassium uptake protein [Actinobacteria bacterium]|nr:TrkA family potassium uptake protein [Actinomycetota bacterium]MBU4240001.1 TrkA family potassium uptake protein [Actinomycetota bacterium]MBU4301891.1 TrkA family potassium uptake protein [Actinomycetota bacterium]MBU4489062.1 TrkA family potassium uptake protein [Actinomycetota bacterium]MCG2794723.1 TrkA family potassium uptake protein [Actinomycetes bacterium]